MYSTIFAPSFACSVGVLTAKAIALHLPNEAERLGSVLSCRDIISQEVEKGNILQLKIRQRFADVAAGEWRRSSTAGERGRPFRGSGKERTDKRKDFIFSEKALDTGAARC